MASGLSRMAWVVSGLSRTGLNRAGLNHDGPESWRTWIMQFGPESCLIGLNPDGPELSPAWIVTKNFEHHWPESCRAWIVLGLNRSAWIVGPESYGPESNKSGYVHSKTVENGPPIAGSFEVDFWSFLEWTYHLFWCMYHLPYQVLFRWYMHQKGWYG